MNASLNVLISQFTQLVNLEFEMLYSLYQLCVTLPKITKKLRSKQIIRDIKKKKHLMKR